jgi:threonine dehydrogenase-like Zn-dependent dehydrogenase
MKALVLDGDFDPRPDYAVSETEIKTRIARRGADVVYNPQELTKQGSSPHEVVMDLTDGYGADMHVECSGVPKAALPEIEQSLAVNAKVVNLGRRALIASRRLNIPKMITARYPLDRAVEAITSLANREGGKVMVRI